MAMLPNHSPGDTRWDLCVRGGVGGTAIAIAEALRDKGLERMILTVRADNEESLARRQVRIVSMESRGWVVDP